MDDSFSARYPLDERTSDLLIVLSSKLQAMHVYERLVDADHSHRELVRQLMADDARHADMLLEALRDRLMAASPREHMTQPVGQGGPNDPAAPHGRSGLADPGSVREGEVQRESGNVQERGRS